MAHHLLDLEQIATTDPLSALLKNDGQRTPTAVTDLASARAYLRENATTTHHPCGTAAMLRREKGGGGLEFGCVWYEQPAHSRCEHLPSDTAGQSYEHGVCCCRKSRRIDQSFHV